MVAAGLKDGSKGFGEVTAATLLREGTGTLGLQGATYLLLSCFLI